VKQTNDLIEASEQTNVILAIGYLRRVSDTITFGLNRFDMTRNGIQVAAQLVKATFEYELGRFL
jgi:hypothetical protein